MNQSVIFYGAAGLLLLISLIKDKKKTSIVLKKSFKSFVKLLPQMSFILILIGLSLTIVSPDAVSRLVGSESGILGILSALAVGAIAFLPSFIAFPLGATLLEQGAGLLQVATFIAALMGIGIMTFPMEKKFFGTSFAIYRNLGSLMMTLIFVTVLFLVTGGTL